VVHGGETYKLSLVPSGAVRGKVGVLGGGCVVNPRRLFDELDGLREQGLDPDIRVARRAHIVFPYHRALDGIEERAKSDDNKEVGTTGRGIGPAYEDKAGRRGVRAADLTDPNTLRERLEYVVPQKQALAEDVFGAEADERFDLEMLYEEYREYGRRLDEEGMLVDAGAFLGSRIEAGDALLLEGAQGTVLDIDHGNYPYVTSSNPTAGGAATGTGLAPDVVGEEVVGVVKAYLSRVGSGPMPTELGGVPGDTPGYTEGEGEAEALAERIREAGGEYGTVTGRPRRVGWLDLPMLRYAARTSGFTGLAVNHIDTLAGFDEVRVAEAYRLEGERLEQPPATVREWGACDPVYRAFEGWPKTVAGEGYDALPANARAYLEYVSEETGVDLYAVGVGPEREETIVLEHPL
jgi:adenylosuccinate synthase